MKQEQPTTKQVSSFQEGISLIDSGRLKPKERELTLRALASIAETFDQWLELFYRAKEKSVFEQEALKQLTKRPANKAELLEVLEFAPEASDLRKTLEGRLKAQGVPLPEECIKPFRVTSAPISERSANFKP